MSEPFTEICQYCGSSEIMDDAWLCDECEYISAYERAPLTSDKALSDLSHTKASVWGPASIAIENAAGEIARLAKMPVTLRPDQLAMDRIRDSHGNFRITITDDQAADIAPFFKEAVTS